MTTVLTFSLIRIAWFTWMLFWIWSARGVKRTERRESFGSRLSYFCLIICGALVMSQSRVGPQLLAHSETLNVVAVALSWTGVLFSIWARAILGRNWSDIVTLKQGHQLIDTGPYLKVRNPIYSGILLAGAGLVLALGSIEAIAGFAIVFVALLWKSKVEERMLSAHFGSVYLNYQARTKLLIPYLF